MWAQVGFVPIHAYGAVGLLLPGASHLLGPVMGWVGLLYLLEKLSHFSV